MFQFLRRYVFRISGAKRIASIVGQFERLAAALDAGMNDAKAEREQLDADKQLIEQQQAALTIAIGRASRAATAIRSIVQ